jgi:hypothetical protein
MYILPWNLEEAEVVKETPKKTDRTLSLITYQPKSLELVDKKVVPKDGAIVKTDLFKEL